MTVPSSRANGSIARTTTDADTMLTLWEHIYGPGGGNQRIALFSGLRADGPLDQPRPMSYLYPEEVNKATTWIERNAHEGRETYMCAHLLTARDRKKENAAPMWALYVDGDGATVPDHLPAPTAIVRSSPGREQYYWRLSRPVDPEIGEQLNRRLAYAMNADKSGWDRTQLLRPPGTPNRKYPGSPIVTLADLDDTTAYNPDELLRTLPAAPAASIGRSHDVGNIGDAPPVDTIEGSDLALWRGETPALKDNGEIDRSTTLYRIGAMLHRHGITASWIVAAIEERDQSLGYLRYVGRPDQYQKIAEKVSAESRMRHIPADPITEPRDDDDRLIALSARFDQLKAAHRALQQRHSNVIQVIDNPTYTPAEAVSYIRAQFEYERLIAAGQCDGKRVTLYLPKLSMPLYTDNETGKVLTDNDVYERQQRKDLDTTTERTTSLAPATISKALRTVAERSNAFIIDEMKDPKTGKTRLTMEPIEAETMAAVAQAFVKVDRRRGPGRATPKDRRLATIDPCLECSTDADVLIKADAYCTSCGDHLGALPDERIAAPFQIETVEDTPPTCEPSTRDVQFETVLTGRAGFWAARERHFDIDETDDDTPFQLETNPQPLTDRCRDCGLALYGDKQKAAGRHDYDCRIVRHRSTLTADVIAAGGD